MISQPVGDNSAGLLLPGIVTILDTVGIGKSEEELTGMLRHL